jgi:DNA-binding FadR family transcriptional regulator
VGRSEAAGIEEARRTLGEMRAAGSDPEAFEAADIHFHLALVRASGNRANNLVILPPGRP